MIQALATDSVRHLFTDARTHHAWLEKGIDDQLLHSLYETMKWGPTSVNCGPLRIVFVRSKEAKEKMLPALMGSNSAQVQTAPVTAILAWDEKFYDELPTLFPAFDARAMFASNAEAAHATAFRNSSLQSAYFILAARALGLDTCPMSGFDNAKLDEAFLKGTSWKSNLICALGYGDHSKLYPRGPRLNFDVACKII